MLNNRVGSVRVAKSNSFLLRFFMRSCDVSGERQSLSPSAVISEFQRIVAVSR
jgi:hypothetical protein